MRSAGYDILRKDDVYLIWVEQARDLKSARLRIIQLAAQSHIEHVVVDQATHLIVARARPRAGDQCPFGSSFGDEM
jgi:hypothetical protein